MNAVWEKIANNASDAKTFVEEISASGIQFLQSNLEKIPLFSATHAEINRRIDRDEIHYFLVPFQEDETGFALYTIRSLPPEVGPVNSLEKARIFHLHDPAGIEILESLIISNHKSELTETPSDSQSDFADRLDELAKKIDNASTAATGGFIIVGSLVALTNPLLGAGIAAKALFPSLGSFATTSGIKFLGDKFRKSAENREAKKLQKLAEKEAKRLKPEVKINPILHDLQALDLEKSAPVKVLPFDDWLLELETVESIRLTNQAIQAVYQESLALPPRKSPLSPAQSEWLREVNELSEATLADS